MKQIFKNELGLTLIELLATIVILAIIAAIAIPSIAVVIQNQRDKAIISDISNFVSSSKTVYAADECGDDHVCTYTPTTNELDFKSSKYTEAYVDFNNGSSPDDILIKVEIDPNIFKGKKADQYKELFDLRTDGWFTEAELLDAMNQ